jgi:signal transduction histidine kinase
MRTVRGRITWLIALTSFAFLTSAIIWFVSMRSQTRMLGTYDRIQKLAFARTILSLQQKPLRLASEKVGLWGDVGRFFQRDPKKGAQWAGTYLRGLLTPDIQAVWAFDSSGKRLFSAGRNIDVEKGAPLKFPEITRMAQYPGSTSYRRVRMDLAELMVSPIYEPDDLQRTRPVIGYLVFASVFDEPTLMEMGNAIGAEVRTQIGTGRKDDSDGTVWIPLMDYEGKHIGALQFDWYANPALVQIETARTTSLALIAAFAALFILVIVVALTRWVSDPLRGIYAGLAANDPPAILAAASELDEFKSLADALCDAVIQRERLKEWNQELEAHVKERTHELQKALLVRGHFLANVSHELRTPLNGVIGMAYLLSDTGLNGEQQEYAETIVASGEQLLVLINDLLDFEKAAAGKLTIERIPLSVETCLSRISDSFRARAAQRGNTLIMTCDPTMRAPILGDPVRVTQILNNIVGNAIKFTENGVVEVFAGREGDDVVLQISDTGVGITAHRLGLVLEAFEQADISTFLL